MQHVRVIPAIVFYPNPFRLLSQGWEPAGHRGQRQPARVPRQPASGVWVGGVVLVRRTAGGQPGLRAPATATHQPQPHQ